ncbi:hypothetical protein OG244_35610 [Streptomyces brevispora]|uniref:hypothetical protein n=1 Tax=Streptomyces brevispora TaxID=887462 RepID=UPI002E37CA13|nr:hypothetical protein [Streptomyces brevispora]
METVASAAPSGAVEDLPAAGVDQLQERLEERAGAFGLPRYDSEAAARTAIEHRAVYSAVAVTAKGWWSEAGVSGVTVLAIDATVAGLAAPRPRTPPQPNPSAGRPTTLHGSAVHPCP